METFSASLILCAGNSLVTGEFSFDAELWCFLRSAPDKQLSKQTRRWWFETPSRSVWRHCNRKRWGTPSTVGTWGCVAQWPEGEPDGSILCQTHNYRIRHNVYTWQDIDYTIIIMSHERHNIGNCRWIDSLFDSFLGLIPTKTSKFHITGPLWEESAGYQWFRLMHGPVCGISFQVMRSSFQVTQSRISRVNITSGTCRVNIMSRTCRVNIMPGTYRVNIMPRTCRVKIMSRICRVNIMSRTCRVNIMSRTCRVNIMSRTCRVNIMSRTYRVNILPGTCRVNIMSRTYRVNILPGTCRVNIMSRTCRVKILSRTCRVNIVPGTCRVNIMGQTCRVTIVPGTCRVNIMSRTCRASIMSRTTRVSIMSTLSGQYRATTVIIASPTLIHLEMSGYDSTYLKQYNKVSCNCFVFISWWGNVLVESSVPFVVNSHIHGGTTEEGNCSYLLSLSHRDIEDTGSFLNQSTVTVKSFLRNPRTKLKSCKFAFTFSINVCWRVILKYHTEHVTMFL